MMEPLRNFPKLDLRAFSTNDRKHNESARKKGADLDFGKVMREYDQINSQLNETSIENAIHGGRKYTMHHKQNSTAFNQSKLSPIKAPRKQNQSPLIDDQNLNDITIRFSTTLKAPISQIRNMQTSPLAQEPSYQESKRIIFKPKEVVVQQNSLFQNKRRSRLGDDSLLEMSLLDSSPAKIALSTKISSMNQSMDSRPQKYLRLSHDKIEELKQTYQTPKQNVTFDSTFSASKNQTYYREGAGKLFNVEKQMEQYLLNDNLGAVSRREGASMVENTLSGFDEPKKGISILTMVQNYQASSALKQLDISHSHEKGPDKILVDDFDNHQILMTTQREIKTLNNKLSKIFSSGNTHIDLTMGKGNEITVNPEEVSYAKFPIRDLGEPVKFLFKLEPMLDPSLKSDLQVYLSTTFREPNSDNCDKAYKNKPLFVFDPKTSEKTKKSHFLYLSFMTSQVVPCTFNLKIKFNEKQFAAAFHDPRDDLNAAFKYRDKVQVYKEKIDELQASIDAAGGSRKKYHVNFVIQNRLTVTDWQTDYRLERIQDLNQQTARKISLCQERKYHLEEKKRVDLENEAKIKAHLKIKRQRESEARAKVKAQQGMCKKVISLVESYKIVKEIWRRYVGLRHHRNLIERQLVECLKLQRCLKKLVMKRGPNFEVRSQRSVQYSFKIIGQLNIEVSEERAKQVLFDFLKDGAVTFAIKDKFRKFMNGIVSIQRGNRSRISSLKSRHGFFCYYWEILKVEISKALMSEKKQAAKTLSCNMFAISERVRDYFCHLYNQHQRLIFIEKFMQYRMTRCEELGVTFTFDWESEKPKLEEERKAIELDLYENLDEQARETLNQMMAKMPVRKDQKFKLKNIKVTRDASELSDYKDGEKQQKGPPMFTYLPSKTKLIKILLKAAQYQASGQTPPKFKKGSLK